MHFSLPTAGALRAVTIGFFVALLALGSPVLAQQRLGPFTQPPRSVRSRSIDQQHVRLEFRFDWDQQKVQAKAIHTLALVAPKSTLELDAAEMQVTRATLLLEGQEPAKLTHRQQGNQLAIELGRELPANQKFQLAIDYTIDKPKHGFHFVVPDESEPNQPRMIWTQSEPEYARYWFPCFDAPNDRLTSEIIA
ncbi:MAG: hypothetical protein WEH44_10955, partial [Pirellulaceae bacterium]